ncbi:MAG: hypothetical protein ACLUHE_17135 [Christensenellales bacterium]
MNYIVAQAVEQAEAGAQILDVERRSAGYRRAGNHARRVVTAIGGAVSLPLQIDSSARRRSRRVCAPRRESVWSTA